MALVVPAQVVAETEYETAPPPVAPTHFCGGGAASARLTPFKPRPRLHSPRPDGRMGFGPTGLLLTPLPRLIVDAGSVGYSLALTETTAAVHPNWDVTTVLTLIDWRGTSLKALRRVHRQVGTVNEGEDVGVRFPVKSTPAFYRVTTVFDNEAGKRLGEFGFYFRVASWTEGAHLVLDSNSYRPGETVIGRVDSLGPEAVLYGQPYAIERQAGPSWVPAPESPRGPWLMVGYITSPGYAGRNCSRFHIPAGMRPGRYRMSKDYGTRANFRQADNLTAEFSVLPTE
ncbi:MAG TPA: immunoglobulin-like domain-containing protein [Solirubrobacterales bacterium]